MTSPSMTAADNPTKRTICQQALFAICRELVLEGAPVRLLRDSLHAVLMNTSSWEDVPPKDLRELLESVHRGSTVYDALKAMEKDE